MEHPTAAGTSPSAAPVGLRLRVAGAGIFFCGGVMAAIYRKFGMPRLSDADRAIIKHADNVALATEARDLMGDPQWPGLPEPHPEPVESWMPGWARRVFLLDVIRLNGADDRGAKDGQR